MKKLFCSECTQETYYLKRKLCDRCYMRQYNKRDMKPACEVCAHADARALVRRRLNGSTWTTLCGNCATIAGRRKMDVSELEDEVFPEGDRRQPNRRVGSSRRGAHRREINIGALDGNEKRSRDRRAS